MVGELDQGFGQGGEQLGGFGRQLGRGPRAAPAPSGTVPSTSTVSPSRPRAPPRHLHLPVERWGPGPDQPALDDGGRQRPGAHPVVHGIELTEQPAGPPRLARRERRPDPGAQVGRLAHVEHVAGGVGAPVDAWTVGEAHGEAELGRLGVSHQPGQVEQLPEFEDPEGSGPLQQRVEEVAGGQHVGQRPVGGLVGETERGGQGAEPAVVDLVAHQAPGQGQGVDGRIHQSLPPRGDQGVVEEREVEAEIVAHQHRPADELQKGRKHLADPGCVGHHGVVDSGECGDERGDAVVGPDERLIGPELLPAPVPRCRHLGERGARRRTPRGLDVDHHEGHLAERCAGVVERLLPCRGHGDTLANRCSLRRVRIPPP